MPQNDQSPSLAAAVRELLPNAEFGPPCGENTLLAAEALLGHRVPEPLRHLYAEFDGCLDKRTHVGILPLGPKLGSAIDRETAVGFTLFIRTSPEFEDGLAFWTQKLFIGGNGSNIEWVVDSNPPYACYEWNPTWGPEYKLAEQGLIGLIDDQIRLINTIDEEQLARPWWKRWFG